MDSCTTGKAWRGPQDLYVAASGKMVLGAPRNGHGFMFWWRKLLASDHNRHPSWLRLSGQTKFVCNFDIGSLALEAERGQFSNTFNPGARPRGYWSG